MREPAQHSLDHAKGLQCRLDPFALQVFDGDHAVRDALRRLRIALAPLDLELEEFEVVELVLAEALNNIVEHAYPKYGHLGDIAIRVRHQRNGLHVRITDDGVPLPDGKIPLGTAAPLETDISRLPEGGFGWFLINGLAKDVRYHREERRNHLDFRLAVALERHP